LTVAVFGDSRTFLRQCGQRVVSETLASAPSVHVMTARLSICIGAFSNLYYSCHDALSRPIISHGLQQLTLLSVAHRFKW